MYQTAFVLIVHFLYFSTNKLKNFKDFAFRKFDQLKSRSTSGSSSSGNVVTTEDEETTEENYTKPMDPLQKKSTQKTTPPPRRKLWEKTPKVTNPWTLRFEGNDGPADENNPDEAGRTIPIRPGTKTYSGAVRSSSAPPETTDFTVKEKSQKIENIKRRRQGRESKTLIFSDSITRDIKKRTFNLECTTTDVIFHEFRGKKAKDIIRYTVPHLEDEQPSSVILAAGGNDLPERDISSNDIRKVADCLLEGGRLCREHYGVANVLISSIMPRTNSHFQGNRHRLNAMLKEMCHANQFTFIDNNNIVLRPHGHPDGVHLNGEGSDLLHVNLLNVLNY